MTVGWRAVGRARLRNAAAEYLRIIGLANDDLGVRAFLFEHPRDAFQGAAGAESGHPVVQSLALEVCEDLRGGGIRVRVGVSLVFELPGQVPAMLFGQFDCLGKHATALELGRGQDDLGAQESHHLATLDAETLGHGND